MKLTISSSQKIELNFKKKREKYRIRPIIQYNPDFKNLDDFFFPAKKQLFSLVASRFQIPGSKIYGFIYLYIYKDKQTLLFLNL